MTMRRRRRETPVEGRGEPGPVYRFVFDHQVVDRDRKPARLVAGLPVLVCTIVRESTVLLLSSTTAARSVLGRHQMRKP